MKKGKKGLSLQDRSNFFEDAPQGTGPRPKRARRQAQVSRRRRRGGASFEKRTFREQRGGREY